jgi:hypothetical protein
MGGMNLLRILHADRPMPPAKHTVQWQFTTADARTKLTRLYPAL